MTKYHDDLTLTGRIDVIEGPTGRRKWPDEMKGKIVAETLHGDETAADVARRFRVCPSQVYLWRRLAREGKLALPAEDIAMFTPVAIDERLNLPLGKKPRAAAASIEISALGAVIRMEPDTPAARIAEIVRALNLEA